MALRSLLVAFVIGATRTLSAEPFLSLHYVDQTIWANGEGEDSPSSPVLLEVGNGVVIRATFSVTSKGNGVLEWDGGLVRLYDSHQDDVIFEPTLLENALVDLDGDGYKDMVLWGNAVLSDDDEDRIERCPVVSILKFNPLTRNFALSMASEHIYVLLQSNQPVHATPDGARDRQR